MDGKILIVHRNQMVLDVIQEMLQNVGFATTLTTDGHQALAKALSEHYKLIIVDRNLSGSLDGMRLVERLRKYGVRSPIIGTSPEGTWQTTEGDPAPEVDRFLPSPFGYGDLIRVAESLLERSLEPTFQAEPDPEPALPVAPEPLVVPEHRPTVEAARPSVSTRRMEQEIKQWEPPAVEDVAGPARILVVDQDDEARERTAGLLSEAGYAVTGIQNGQEAYETTMLDDFDMILCDLWLVDMDGFEMIDAVRKSGVDCPIAVLTSHVTRDMVKELAASKVSRIFVKPAKPALITEFVAATVKRS